MKKYDVAIIGAGIAGASIASEIGAHRSVLLLEAEDQPGYHATGRSAAFWTETYGGPLVQPLTSASRDFLENPPREFSETSFLSKRGAINISRDEEAHLAEKFVADFADSEVAMEFWNPDQMRALLPNLKEGWSNAVYEPDCCDIDVAALHAAYLKDAKRKSVDLRCRSRVVQIERLGDGWAIEAGDQHFHSDILINASGAWADEIAAMAAIMPVGIQPYARNIVQIETDPPSSPNRPLVVGLDGSFYFKPEAGGNYWISPHDEIPDVPSDVAPDELSVATAIDRFEAVLDVEVKKVTRKWAGLRSFAPDRLPVIGFDPDDHGFFWFAGQGGFGIQTAPAAAQLAKSLFLKEPPNPGLEKIDAARYGPARFH